MGKSLYLYLISFVQFFKFVPLHNKIWETLIFEHLSKNKAKQNCIYNIYYIIL